MLKASSSAKAQSIAGQGSLERIVETLENWLEKCQFIAANHFTAADIVVASVINFAKKGLLARPGQDRYSKSMCACPAFKKVAEIDNAKAKEMVS